MPNVSPAGWHVSRGEAEGDMPSQGGDIWHVTRHKGYIYYLVPKVLNTYFIKTSNGSSSSIIAKFNDLLFCHASRVQHDVTPSRNHDVELCHLT